MPRVTRSKNSVHTTPRSPLGRIGGILGNGLHHRARGQTKTLRLSSKGSNRGPGTYGLPGEPASLQLAPERGTLCETAVSETRTDASPFQTTSIDLAPRVMSPPRHDVQLRESTVSVQPESEHGTLYEIGRDVAVSNTSTVTPASARPEAASISAVDTEKTVVKTGTAISTVKKRTATRQLTESDDSATLQRPGDIFVTIPDDFGTADGVLRASSERPPGDLSMSSLCPLSVLRPPSSVLPTSGSIAKITTARNTNPVSNQQRMYAKEVEVCHHDETAAAVSASHMRLDDDVAIRADVMKSGYVTPPCARPEVEQYTSDESSYEDAQRSQTPLRKFVAELDDIRAASGRPNSRPISSASGIETVSLRRESAMEDYGVVQPIPGAIFGTANRNTMSMIDDPIASGAITVDTVNDVAFAGNAAGHKRHLPQAYELTAATRPDVNGQNVRSRSSSPTLVDLSDVTPRRRTYHNRQGATNYDSGPSSGPTTKLRRGKHLEYATARQPASFVQRPMERAGDIIYAAPVAIRRQVATDIHRQSPPPNVVQRHAVNAEQQHHTRPDLQLVTVDVHRPDSYSSDESSVLTYAGTTIPQVPPLAPQVQVVSSRRLHGNADNYSRDVSKRTYNHVLLSDVAGLGRGPADTPMSPEPDDDDVVLAQQEDEDIFITPVPSRQKGRRGDSPRQVVSSSEHHHNAETAKWRATISEQPKYYWTDGKRSQIYERRRPSTFYQRDSDVKNKDYEYRYQPTEEQQRRRPKGDGHSGQNQEVTDFRRSAIKSRQNYDRPSTKSTDCRIRNDRVSCDQYRRQPSRHHRHGDTDPDDSDSDDGHRRDDDYRHGSHSRPPERDRGNSSDGRRSRRDGSRRGSGRRGHGRDDGNDDSPPPSRRQSRSRSRGRGSRGRRNGSHTPLSDDDAPESPKRHRPDDRSKHQWIKPKEFSGETSFESFMVRFESAAKFNHWREKEKLAWLQSSVTGPAAQLLWSAGNLSYKQLVKRLEDRYGSRGMEERFQAEMRYRRRRNGESIQELAQDIRRLMSLAYPGKEDSDLGEHIARDAFLTALNDAEMETKIREQEPKTFEKAVKLALRIEVTSAAVTRSGSRRGMLRQVTSEEPDFDTLKQETKVEVVEHQGRRDASSTTRHDTNRERDRQSSFGNRGRRPTKDKEQRNRAATKDEDPRMEELMKKMQEIEVNHRKEIETIKQENSQRKQTHQAQTPMAQQPNIGQQLAYQQPAGAINPYGQMSGTMPPSVCWSCGEEGHYSRQCPKKQRNVPAPVQGPSQGQLQYLREFRTSSVTHSAGFEEEVATYLRARVNGRSRRCLLDSGSEATILPSNLVPKNRMIPAKSKLRAANGTEIAVRGRVTVPLTTPWYRTTIDGLVSDHVAEVILGIDWLADNDAQWSFKDGTVNLGGHKHQLEIAPKRHNWCRRVVLQEDTVVPPMSQQEIACRVEFLRTPRDDRKQLWETETATLPCGLLVARTLTPPDKLTDVPVRVMNLNSEPKRVTAGTRVSVLEPVDVVVVENSEAKSAQTSPDPRGRPVSFNVRSVLQGGSEQNPEFIRKLVNKVDDATPESTVIKLQELLLEYRNVFSESEADLGLTHIMEHKIDTGAARPVRQQLRKFPPAHVEAISQHVDSMLQQGVIQPASSPWASNVVLVKKKDGTYRCCIDYRQLNNVTTRDAYPLPRVDSCLDAMSGAGWFSTIDLRSSYHQVHVAPEDQQKTAFICPRGMYQFRTMPFGLCNAGATFQRLMDIVMSGLHLDICLVYLDDIVVFSKTPVEHLQRLELVFQRLREAGLKMKPEKCSFLRRSVSFLGHIVSARGIETDEAKVKAVTEWPTPRTVSDVRSFVGLASYYRRFVKNFAQVAAPLHRLTQKDQRFQWTTEAQQSFDALKTALTSPPILAMPNDTGPFTLDTDASNYTIGAVLSQEQDGMERVVAYASRSLNKNERNYCVTRKELLAVVHFLKYFKQYLLGREFRIRTDHAALTWLKKTPEPIGQQARWLEQMEEFNFTIEHRPGARHTNADALSRRPCTRNGCLCKGSALTSFGEPADQHVINQSPDADVRNFSSPPGGCPNTVIPPNDAATGSSHRLQGGPADRSGIVRPNKKQRAKQRTLQNIEEEDELPLEESSTLLVRAHTAEPPTQPKATALVTDAALNGVHHDDVITWSPEGIRDAQKADPDIGCIYGLVEAGVVGPAWDQIASQSKDTKTLWSFWPRLQLRDGVLNRLYQSIDGREDVWQVVVPRTHREEFLRYVHGGQSGGHAGQKKTAAAVQMRAYWPSWSQDVAACLKKCPECARYHRGTPPKSAEMQTPLAGEPWEKISVDITGPHPRSSRQNKFILTLVDHFSKWAEAIPLQNHTAASVAGALTKHVFSRFGQPLQLLTDQGPEFESDLFSQLLRWSGVEKLRTTAYKPSTNGVVERFHRTLNAMLGKVISDGQRDWDEKLPAVMAAYRATVHSSTGYTPNKLFLGRENRMPIDLAMGLSPEQSNGDQSVDEYIYRQQELAESAYRTVREHLGRSAERRKSAYDARVRRTTFDVGQWVWYYYPRRYTAKSPKWQRNFIGPFRIVKIIPPVNYVLQKSPKSNKFVVHADKIKVCHTPPKVDWTIRDEGDVVDNAPTIPPITDDTPQTDGERRASESPLLEQGPILECQRGQELQVPDDEMDLDEDEDILSDYGHVSRDEGEDDLNVQLQVDSQNENIQGGYWNYGPPFQSLESRGDADDVGAHADVTCSPTVYDAEDLRLNVDSGGEELEDEDVTQVKQRLDKPFAQPREASRSSTRPRCLPKHLRDYVRAVQMYFAEEKQQLRV